MKKFLNLEQKQIIIYGYVLCLILLWPLKGIALWGFENIASCQGKMDMYEFGPADIEFINMGKVEGVENSYISTNDDPQMIIILNSPLYVRDIYVKMSFSVHPGQTIVYYTQKENQAFSERKRIESKLNSTQGILYETTIKKMNRIRIDPTMYAGNIMEIEKIIINTEKQMIDYFMLSFADIFKGIIGSSFIVSAVVLIQNLLKEIKGYEK